MATRVYAGRTVTVTDEGFLTDRALWTPEIAAAIASEAGIPTLDAEHWRVIGLCREHDAREGRPPSLERLSTLSGFGTEDLQALFPRSPGTLAARIAGLPKPGGRAGRSSDPEVPCDE